LEVTSPDAIAQSLNPMPPATPPESRVPQRTLGDLIYDLVARHSLIFLLALLAIYVAYAVAQSHQKTLWYDEIFSVIVAIQPTWHRTLLAMPADGNPPLYALLTRLSIHLFGMSDLAVRLPSILAFLVALIEIYIFVRREAGAVFGFLAVVLTLSEPGWNYSFEARPYALLLCLMMLGLVSWQSAIRARAFTPPRPRLLALTGMVVAIAGSILAHNVGIIEVGVPLLFGEAVRLYRTRRPDWPVLATALAAIPALTITLPMMHRTRDLLLTASQAWLHPITLAKLHTYWISTASLSIDQIVNAKEIRILAVLAFVIWTPGWLNRSRRTADAPSKKIIPASIPPHSIAAALGALLVLPSILFALMFSTGYYNCRYGIGIIAGISLLACLFFARRGGRQPILCSALLVYFLFTYVHDFVGELRLPPSKADIIDPDLTANQSNLPITVADPLVYLPTWWHAPASMKDKIVYLADKPASLKYGYVVIEVALMAEKPLLSAPLLDYSNFLATHDHFLIYLTPGSPTEVLKKRVEDAGYRTTLLNSPKGFTLYDVQRAPAAQLSQAPSLP
jgi:hypothetical protein